MAHKLFRDAIHGMISLDRESLGPATDPVAWGDALILELIDSPPVQRLRRIRQLGAAARIYPTGEHSRFSHALGVMFLTRRILASLLDHHPDLLAREEILQIKVAALLHDLGHGPYSHVFEQVLDGVFDHERMGWELISGPGPARSIIYKHCRRLGIEPHGFFVGLGQILGVGGRSGPPPLGGQIISSQLDADRMDYLLRDAYFTGVSYGRFDLDWLIHSLRVRESDGVKRLCVDISKGPAALESYLAARDNMYRQVYDHKTVRAFDALLFHFFDALRWAWAGRGAPPPGTPPELARFLEAAWGFEPGTAGAGPPDPGLLGPLDDAVLDYAIGHWAGALLSEEGALAELGWKCRLLRDRQPVYRRLAWRIASDRGDPEETTAGLRSEIIHDAAAAGAINRFFEDQAETPVPLEGAPGHPAPPLRLLVRVDNLQRAPYAHLRYTPGAADPIYVLDGASGPIPAEEASQGIHLLGRSPRRLVRVFVDPRAVKAVEALIQAHFSHPGLAIAEGPT